jgi:hypothetical protein
MATRIKIYKGTVTAGSDNGTLVSSGTGAEPIQSGALKVPAEGYAEGSAIKLAVRCDSGYETVEDDGKHATIAIVDSTHVDKWALAPDDEGSPGEFGDYGDPLVFLSQIDDTNTIFWAKARVAYTEEPANDTSVDIEVSALIGAA